MTHTQWSGIGAGVVATLLLLAAGMVNGSEREERYEYQRGDDDRNYERHERNERRDDDDRYERGERYQRDADDRGQAGYSRNASWGGPDVPPVTNETYRNECGSCHFAYQPALLPARSWQAVMGNLSNHFGDDASLAAETVQELERYLVANAADSGDAGRGERIANSVTGTTPLRITETPYFRRKHHEVPTRMVEGNPEVGSFSRCSACHAEADQGRYDEHSVRIPGVGRWED